MTRWILAMLAVVGLIGTGTAYAQESVPGPGAVVITIIPGGGTFFTEGKDTQGPSLGNYDLGAGVEVHFNRYVGVEGEVSGGLGVKQGAEIDAFWKAAERPAFSALHSQAFKAGYSQRGPVEFNLGDFIGTISADPDSYSTR